MKYFIKNYLFFLLAISVILVHQFIFQSYFPNKNLLLGNDYSQHLPNLVFGKIWFHNNFLSIPWFSPSFCCGMPFFADPQTMYYSFQQLFFIFFSPLLSLKLIFLFFSLIGFFGTFYLTHKSFKKNIYISLIAASLFLFNGYINYRGVVGHITHLSYVFIPFYCFFLIKSFENNKNKFKSILYILISSLIFANFIYSGSGAILIIIVLSIIFIISIYAFLNEKLTIFNYLFFSLLFGLFVSLSKINASLAFLNNFPREYTGLVFENYHQLIINTFKSLFLYPDISKFNSSVINEVTNNLKIHETEFGISIVPLIIFIIFLTNFKKIIFNKFTLKKLITLSFMIVIVIFAIVINVSNNELGIFLKKLPIIKSTWVNFRYTAIYILPLIIMSCLMIEKIISKENNIKIFTFVCLALILIQNYIYKENYYHSQRYNHESLEKLHFNKELIQNLKIENTVLLLDKNKKPVITIQRNNLFVHQLSPLLCYQPIFGYDLKSLPTEKITFDKINKINKNLFAYNGTPTLVNENKAELNFFNPSCFIFPNENKCVPGDLFKESQINELKNFLNYKTFNFQLSKLQKIFNYISIISFIFIMTCILYCIIKINLKKD